MAKLRNGFRKPPPQESSSLENSPELPTYKDQGPLAMSNAAQSVAAIQQRAYELIDPHEVVSDGVNRYANSYGQYEADELLLKDIEATGGNRIPGVVRELPRRDKQGHRFRLIYGSRRLWACRQLNLNFSAFVVRSGEEEDSADIIDRIRENARLDPSPYEWGLIYEEALRSGVIESQEKLARVAGCSAGSIAKARKIAKLPHTLIELLGGSPYRLEFRRAYELAVHYNEKTSLLEERITQLLENGYVAQDEKEARRLLQHLKDWPEEHHPNNSRSSTTKEVLVERDSKPLVTLKRTQRGRVSFYFTEEVDEDVIDQIKQQIISYIN